MAETARAFPHGVASGEVTRNDVRLWTWYAGAGPLTLDVQEGGRVVATQEVGEDADRPHVFLADVDGLEADHRYDYTFTAPDGTSTSGGFRTLPPDGVPVRFGVVSCAKYNAGFFNGYRALADRDDLHFVLHLGDYIYEASNTPRGNQTPGADIGRPFDPLGECLSFEDYMTRYRQYRLDPDLLACHARHAFWQTIDDHELADNAWIGGAEDHRDDVDGPWADRVAGAMRAWEYWVPSRLRPTRGDAIGRTFAIGTDVQVLLLETRLHRDGPTVPDAVRTELGATQKATVEATLSGASTTWTVVACPSMLTPLHEEGLPADVADGLRTLKLMDPHEDAPYHDLWGQFSSERDWLVGQMTASPSKVFVVSGDVHVAVDSTLVNAGESGQAVREWTTGSLTSQNLDDKKGWERNVESRPIVDHLLGRLPDVHWADLDSHGYLVVEVAADDARCEWYAVEAVRQPTDAVEVVHRATWNG